MTNDSRQAEVNKYLAIYDSEPDEASGYGSSAHYREAEEEISSRLSGSRGLLDIGTGKGQFLEYAADDLGAHPVCGLDCGLPPKAWTTETGSWVRRWQGQAVLSPFSPESFDAVTAFDVAEHLLPDDVPMALRHWANLSRKWLVISIATIPDKRLVGGVMVDVHPTVRPLEWWQEQCAAVGSIELVHPSPRRKWRWFFFINTKESPNGPTIK